MPTPKEIFDRLCGPYERVTGRELIPSRFAILCFVTPQTMGDWLQSRPVSPRSQRHLYILDYLINRGGDKGLKAYLSLLETEAKSRGFGSLEDVFRARTWSVKRVADQHAPSSAKKKPRSGVTGRRR